MNLVYCTNIIKDHVFLDKEEAIHLIKVLRKRIGDKVLLTDGVGGFFYEGIIVRDDYNKCEVKITDRKEDPAKRPYYLHILMSPLKSRERYEWFVEKAVEIGVDEITPILTERTEKTKIRIDRLEKIAISALKQTNISTLPRINSPLPFTDYLSARKNPSTLLIAHCQSSKRYDIVREIELLKEKGHDHIEIMIGPEGDFSEEEVKTAIKNKAKPITLSKQRLRTETAGIVAAAFVATELSNRS
jgi:16S rRNA (uracil1498-N3)-methyltransferase